MDMNICATFRTVSTDSASRGSSATTKILVLTCSVYNQIQLHLPSLANVSAAHSTVNNVNDDSMTATSCDTVLRHDYTRSNTFLSLGVMTPYT